MSGRTARLFSKSSTPKRLKKSYTSLPHKAKRIARAFMLEKVARVAE